MTKTMRKQHQQQKEKLVTMKNRTRKKRKRKRKRKKRRKKTKMAASRALGVRLEKEEKTAGGKAGASMPGVLDELPAGKLRKRRAACRKRGGANEPATLVRLEAREPRARLGRNQSLRGKEAWQEVEGLLALESLWSWRRK